MQPVSVYPVEFYNDNLVSLVAGHGVVEIGTTPNDNLILYVAEDLDRHRAHALATKVKTATEARVVDVVKKGSSATLWSTSYPEEVVPLLLKNSA